MNVEQGGARKEKGHACSSYLHLWNLGGNAVKLGLVGFTQCVPSSFSKKALDKEQQ